MKSRPRDEWVRVLNEAAVPCAPINSLDEVFSDPQVLHRGMVVDVPIDPGGTFKMVGLPVKYSGHPATIRRPPPRLGQHTDEVLAEWLGYDPTALANLRRRGILA